MFPDFDGDPDLTPHPAQLDEATLLKSCRVTRGRSSGPGGQHRNKVATAVQITHEPTGVVGWASERRSQERNRAVALFRLRVNLAIEHRRFIPGPMRPATPLGPTELWASRSGDGKIACNPSHRDYPAMLAEALDAVSAMNLNVKAAAGLLGVSMSQLIKLIAAEPKALEQLNKDRAERGLGQIRSS